MRLLSLFLISLLPVLAQAPKVSSIDFYGLQHMKEDRLRKALGFKPGDSLPASKADIEEQLEQVSPASCGRTWKRSAASRMEASRCTSALRSAAGRISNCAMHRTGHPPCPATVMENYDRFLRVVGAASQAGEAAEDLTSGHSMMENREARGLQELFVGYAGLYPKELAAAVRTAADEHQRAAAAYILGYSAKKAAVLADLQFALTDPDDAVRTNAIRSLTAIAVLAAQKPQPGLKVQPTWFIEMLNSLLWSDRRQAARALVTLTESRDAAVLADIRERSLPALVEMAQWKHLDHALPAFLLLGRISGASDQETQEQWSKGDRETLIKAVTKKK